jgi:PLP dependent protein
MTEQQTRTVADNWLRVRRNIERACHKSGRRAEDIRVIAVTKYVDVNRMEETLAAGLMHIGENKAQDIREKWERLNGRGIWHFIGHLQSNKVKYIIDKCAYLHSLDRLSLAKEINKRAKQVDKIMSCFVQVNISGETTKHGLTENEVESFVQQLEQYEHIRAVGLMTMAPHVDNVEESRPVFRRLKSLQLRLRQKGWTHAPLSELSMGMSNDYEVAVEEGATYIRLGSSIVG